MSKARVLLYAACLAALCTRRDDPAPPRDRFRDFEPTASLQVREPEPLAYEGANYRATVGPEGLNFASKLTLGAYEAEQGGRREPLLAGDVSAAGFARARVERGPVVEEYVFENRRAEQLFRIAEPLGEGALTLRVSARSSFGGPVEEVSRKKGGWKELWPFAQGIVFRNATGGVGAMYYGALVFDAAGRSMELDARWERNAIALEVPAEFMSRATYPLTVDPWIEVGAGSASGDGINDNAAGNYDARVAVDALGHPIAAWRFGEDIHVRRWDGSAWIELGGSATGEGISVGGGLANSPAIAVDPSGFPAVAWCDSSSKIYVRRWDGSSWAELGAGSASGGGISQTTSNISRNPAIAFDANGRPIVAWEDTSAGNYEIYARRWDGAAWVEMGTGSASGGGISSSPGLSDDVALATDAGGRAVLVWRDSGGIWIRRWDGTAWIDMGTGSAAGNGISLTAGPVATPALALDPVGNPVVCWSDYSTGNGEIYARRWDGAAWTGIGTDSDQNGGISGNPQDSRDPSIALDSASHPIIAWANYDVGPLEVYLRRWDGSAWLPMGPGSASGGGLSSSPFVISETPSVAFSGGSLVVAWSEGNAGIQSTYVLRGAQRSPLGMKQFQLNGTTFIPTGGTSPVPTMVAKAGLPDETDNYDVRLQVEARLLGIAFSGVPTAEGALAEAGGEASAQLGPLANGSYHWRARVVDAGGLASEWVAFGGNPETEADFVVAVPDTAPQAINVESSDSCGLLGLEILLLLAFPRRRRA